MGSIMSAIRDDEEEYERLCRKYGEQPRMKRDARGCLMTDCYGSHAMLLQARQEKEWADQARAQRASQPTRAF
jgi:hypothetical protein